MMNEIRETVGRRLRDRRHKLGMTQAEVAEKVGVVFQTIQKYETGDATLSVERLVMLAAALGESPGALLGETWK